MTNPTLARGTNTHFTWDETAQAAPATVWRLWTEPSQWSRWDGEVESARIDGEFVQGATGVLKGKGAPASAFTVTRLDQGRGYEVTTALPLGGQLVLRRRLEPQDGQTVFTHEVQFTGFGGWLLAPFLGPKYRQALPVVMGRLKGLAEGSAP